MNRNRVFAFLARTKLRISGLIKSASIFNKSSIQLLAETLKQYKYNFIYQRKKKTFTTFQTECGEIKIAGYRGRRNKHTQKSTRNGES